MKLYPNGVSNETVPQWNFEVMDEYTTGPEGSTQGDFLLEIHETDHLTFDPFPRGASIHDYFHDIEWITELGANEIIREFIAENQNYWKPFRRMTIALILGVSLIFLLIFLIIQISIVGRAIYFSF
jgi:hypothetical protein